MQEQIQQCCNSAMKRLVLRKNWVSKRLKAIRFALINLPVECLIMLDP
jgi:hypothetical protein